MAFEPIKLEGRIEASSFTPIPTEGTGGVGTELPSDVAANVAAQRVAGRQTQETGAFPAQGSQPFAAVSRGLLGGASAELSEAALESAIQRDTFDPNAPQFTNPYTYGVSEIIGGVISPGKILKTGLKAKALLTGAKEAGKEVVKASPRLARTGALYGLGYGAAGGEAEALRQELGPTESLEEIIKGGATGAGVGFVTGGLISKAHALRMNPSEMFMAFVKPKPGSKAEVRTFDFIEGNKLEQAVGSIKNFFKVPKELSLEQAKDLGYSTADKLISRVDDIVKDFKDHKVLGSTLREGLQRDVLDNPILKSLDPKTQSELTRFANEISVDRSLGEAVGLQKNLNSKLRSLIEAIKGGGDPKINDEIQILDSLRSHNSRLLDDAFTGLTGTDDNPYRRWGVVNEFSNMLHSRYRNLFNLRSQEKAAGFFGAPKSGGGLVSIATGPYNYLIGGEMRNSDNLISGMFNKIPEYKIGKLTREAAGARLQRSVLAPTPQRQLTPQELQAQRIAESIQLGTVQPRISGAIPLEQIVGGPIPTRPAASISPQDIDRAIQEAISAREAARRAQISASRAGELQY